MQLLLIIKILVFWTRYTIIDFQAKGIVVVRLVGYRYAGFSPEGNAGVAQVIAEVILVIVAAGDGYGFAFFGLDKVQRAVLVLNAADVVGGGGGAAQDAYFAQFVACGIIGEGGGACGYRDYLGQVQQVVGIALVLAAVAGIGVAALVAIPVELVCGAGRHQAGIAAAPVGYRGQRITGVGVQQTINTGAGLVTVQRGHVAHHVIRNAPFLVACAAYACAQAVQPVVSISIAVGVGRCPGAPQLAGYIAIGQALVISVGIATNAIKRVH